MLLCELERSAQGLGSRESQSHERKDVTVKVGNLDLDADFRKI